MKQTLGALLALNPFASAPNVASRPAVLRAPRFRNDANGDVRHVGAGLRLTVACHGNRVHWRRRPARLRLRRRCGSK